MLFGSRTCLLYCLLVSHHIKSITMTNEVDTQFVRKTNDFALELYKQIISNEDKNIIISPFSISTCLAFAAMGAAGATADDMFSALKYGSSSEKLKVAENYGKTIGSLFDNNSLKIANKMYVMEQYSIKPDFHDIAVNSFQSEAESINFADNSKAAKTINEWVEAKTNNKIHDLISPDALDEFTRMVLVNAIHFKGTWTHQFNPASTRPMPFWVSATESVDVQMMNTKKHFKHGIFEELGLTMLELPYSGSDVTMVILLPDERDGLKRIEDTLLNIDITDLMTKMYTQEVEVFLPKFKIEFNVDLQETLEKIGMGRIFTDQADFSGLLNQSDPLKVSKVIHKAFIEVNEEGAEAAAATGMIAMAMCYIEPTMFVVDRPFYFALFKKQQNYVIFNGRVLNPGQ
ncbi:serine protease inhibitor 42Dd-like isoform X2 [Sabethes cyaneus]|uniref:serine protease inhibitor 42Dd-like isoform X2 n=1 Tax=Sabethes cyaneus TaxID=53552 RepID=UPI00237E75AF|nr:serine protease inhibitor 42Dd-like isoform X2 [Sabethes cyaneus]